MNNFNTERNSGPIGPDIFDRPVAERKVRNDVTAYAYRNGTINIDGRKYVGYSMSEAIMRWRSEQR